jgi:excisionase family DNA binding protein
MELLTPQELCAALKISRTTLYRYTLAGMPHLGRGRLRRFSSDEVLGWLARHPSLVLAPGRYRCRACGSTGRVERRAQVGEINCMDCESGELERISE